MPGSKRATEHTSNREDEASDSSNSSAKKPRKNAPDRSESSGSSKKRPRTCTLLIKDGAVGFVSIQISSRPEAFYLPIYVVEGDSAGANKEWINGQDIRVLCSVPIKRIYAHVSGKEVLRKSKSILNIYESILASYGCNASFNSSGMYFFNIQLFRGEPEAEALAPYQVAREVIDAAKEQLRQGAIVYLNIKQEMGPKPRIAKASSSIAPRKENATVRKSTSDKRKSTTPVVKKDPLLPPASPSTKAAKIEESTATNNCAQSQSAPSIHPYPPAPFFNDPRYMPGAYMPAMPGFYMPAMPSSYMPPMPSPYVHTMPSPYMHTMPGPYMPAIPSPYMPAMPGSYMPMMPDLSYLYSMASTHMPTMQSLTPDPRYYIPSMASSVTHTLPNPTQLASPPAQPLSSPPQTTMQEPPALSAPTPLPPSKPQITVPTSLPPASSPVTPVPSMQPPVVLQPKPIVAVPQTAEGPKSEQPQKPPALSPGVQNRHGFFAMSGSNTPPLDQITLASLGELDFLWANHIRQLQ